MPRNPVNDIRAAGALRSKASTVSGPADEFESVTLIDPSGVISLIGNQGSARSRVYGDGRKWTPIQPALPGSLVAGQYFIQTIAGLDYWVYVDSFGVPHSISGPGGADTQVQFNDGGVLAGDSGFTYNKTTDQLTMTQAGSTSIKLSRITATTGIVTLGAIGDRNGANTFDALQLANAAGTGSLTVKLFDAGTADIVGGGFTTQLNLSLPTSIPVGSAAAPSLAFAGDLDTGLFWVGANNLGVSVGGVLRVDVSTSAITSTIINVLPASTTAAASARLPHGVAPTVPVDGDEWTTTAGLFIRINGVTVGPLANGSGNVVGTAVAGQVTYWTGVSGVAGDAGMVYDDVNNQLALGAGTAALPGYSIVGDLNTGMYGAAADTLGFATGGTLRLSVNTTSITSTVSILLPAGVLATPALAFAADTDTGIYWVGANNLGFSVGGVAIVDITTTTLTINGKLTVTGLIDPTGLALTPVAANPGGGLAASTIWANSLDSNKLYYGATVAGQGTTGSGVANQVTYWSGASTLTGTTTFVFTPAGDGALLAGTSLTLNAASATTSRSIFLQTAGVNRWIQRATGSESGGDSGSDLELLARTDAGGVIDTPITIVRAANGTMTFTRQAVGQVGSAAAPTWSFSGDTNTGMYLAGAETVGFATNSTLRLSVSTTSLTSTLPLLSPDGSAGVPSLSFSSDVNTGIYWIGADNFGFSTGGTKRFDISTTAATCTLPIVLTGSAATGVTVTGAVDATFGHTGAFSLHLETNGVDAITIDSSRVCTFSQQIRGTTGSASVPAYSFTGDTNTGIFWIGTDNVGLSTGGTLRFDVDGSSATFAVRAQIADGSSAAPSLCFTTLNGSGFYKSGTGIGIAASATAVTTITSTTFSVGVASVIGTLSALSAAILSNFGTPYLAVVGDNNVANSIVNVAIGNTSSPASFHGAKTRSTGTDAGTIVQNSDGLVHMSAFGADGATFRISSSIRMEVDGVPALTIVPGRITFLTTNTAGALVEAIRINNTQLVSIASTSSSASTLCGSAAGAGTVLGGFASIFQADTASIVSDSRWGFRPLGSTTIAGLRFVANSTTAAFIDACTFTAGGAYSATKILHLQNGGAGAVVIGADPGGSDLFRVGGALTVNSAVMIQTKTAFTDGAAAAAGTLTNAPAAGNPTKWVPINDNGTTRYVPTW